MPMTLPREYAVKERQTTRISGQLLQDDAVTPLPGSFLTTLTLTVYDTDDAQTVIVDQRNILNTNGGAIDEDGQLVVRLEPADMLIRTSTLPFERHTCLFRWTWDPGGGEIRSGAEELVLVVRNLAKVS
jgi:hypothetical protein